MTARTSRISSGCVLYFLVSVILSSPLISDRVWAATAISGTQSGTLAFSRSPYLVTADLYVPSGQTLAIEPGVVVQLQNPDTGFYVDGTLIAQGSGTAPITFTSDEVQKAPGQWEAIIFRGGSSTNCIMENCTIEYGAARGFSDEAIRMEGASPTIRNCTISNSRLNGITLFFSDARIENCQFLNNGTTNSAAFAIAMRTDCLPQLVNNTASGNGRDAIGVFGGDVNRSGSWGKDNLPYTLVQDTYIAGGRALTIQPGVVVQFQNSDTAMYVDGTLVARGTAGAAIRFTSDETQKAPGQWEAIIIRSGSGTNSVLEHCIVESAAASGFSDEAIRLESSSPTLRNCTISNSRLNGITLFFSDARIETCQFLNNGPTNSAAFAIAMRTDCFPQLINNTASGNGRDTIAVFGGDVNRSGSWGKDNLPYTLVQDTYIAGGRALTIQPGVVMQFQNSDTAMYVDGTLVARGTAGAAIRFTSDETQKAPGQWEAIIIRSGSGTNSVLEHCIVESAAAGGFSNEAIRLESSSPMLRNCTISNSRLNGITLFFSDARIETCQFLNNGTTNSAAFAIAMRTDCFPQLINNTASGNGRDAIAVFGGDVNRSGSWGKDNLPYTLVQDTYIAGGRALTIQPGVEVQFQNPDTAMYVDGTLTARGMAGAAIRFTSDETQKAPGQWEAIIIRSGSGTNSVLEHCIVESAAASGFSDEAIRLESSSPTLRNCTISNSRLNGITLFFSDARIETCQFLNNGPTNSAAFAIAMRTDCFPQLINNTASGNGRDTIAVFGGDVNRSGSWGKDNLPYTLVQDTYIAGGRALTIQPGVVMQFQNSDTAMYVDGTLVARGTAGAAIRFTSDETQKAPGQWEAIIIRSGSGTNSVLEHCIVESAAAGGFSNEAIRLESASPMLRNCTISNSRLNGITLFFSDARIETCQFLNNGPTNSAAFAIAMRTDCFPQLINNTASGNGRDAIAVFGGDVNRSGSWGKDNLPYTLVQDTYIGGGRTLTIQPGVVVQFQNPDTALYVDGTLAARGTAGAAIRFTSDEAQKAPGQWEAIIIRAGSTTNSILENCLIEYAGANSEGAVALFSASPRISDCTIQNSSGDGIHANNSSPAITNTRITGHRRDGVRTVNGANPIISHSAITANTEFGVRNFDTTKIIIARSNYWGDPTGPLDTANTDGLNLTNATSKGSKVSEYVNWGSFLGSDPVISVPIPAIEVSATSLDFGSVTLGQTKDLTLTVRNTGTAALSVNSAASSNSRFAIATPSLPFNVATGALQVVTVRFTPNVAQVEAGTLTLASNDPNRPNVAIATAGIGLAIVSATNCPALPAGLVAWWKAEGNGIDSQGTNHGTLNGVEFVPGEVGHAFSFDGVTNYVGTSLDVQPSAMPSTTWEAWVFPTQPGGRQQILSDDDGGFDRSVMVEGNSFGVFTGGGVWSPANITFSQWQHIAVVFTPTNIAFYKNGVGSLFGFAPSGQLSGSKLQIGRNPGFGEFFKGLIDEVSIYNRALTPDEIQTIYNAGSAGKCPVGGTTSPDIDVLPANLSFGNVSMGQSRSLVVTIRNTGNAALTVNSIASNNRMFGLIAPATPLIMAAGAQQTVTVVFIPTASGNHSGTLTIASNDSDEGALTVAMSGAGVEAAPVSVLLSDSFSRADADRCSLGKADLALGGAGNHFYLPIFPTGGTDPSRPIGANIVSGALQNNGVDFGGVEFVASDGACGNSGIRGENIGQDINIKIDVFVPTDAAANISQAGPYLRSRSAPAGDGIIGGADFDPSGGYWVQLHSSGEVKVKRLYPPATVAITGRPASFNAGAIHTLEIAARGDTLHVALDGSLQTFSQDGTLVTTVSIPNTGTGNQGAAGIAFGAEDNRGKIGGQRVDNLIVSSFRSLDGLPVQNNFVAPPALAVSLVGTGNIVIAWSASALGFVLQSTDELTNPTKWNTVTNRAVVAGDKLTVTVLPGKSSQFYRLIAAGAGTPEPQIASTVVTGEGSISAVQGGTVTLPGGDVTLSVPPGAIERDTQIVITNVVNFSTTEAPFSGSIVLSPSGLTFKQPAMLTLRLPAGLPNPEAVGLHLLSALNPREQSGSEISYFQQITNYTYDAASSTLRVPVEHFSVLTYWLEENVRTYLVFDIPGKYLKRADLLFALTGAGTWFPGHVGLYLGTLNPNFPANDEVTVIESTSEAANLNQVSGVQLSSLSNFKTLQNQHIYMGARRPRFEVTDDERDRIATWALSKKGSLYDYLGSPFITGGGAVGYTCVGFTESAYESVGKSIVPGIQEFLLLPLRQFAYTRAVNEVNLKEGEILSMFVNGVVRPTRFGNYSGNSSYYDVSVAADDGSPAAAALLSGRAKFNSSLNLFSFNPSKEDAELTHVFRFTLDAAKAGLGKVTERLFVKVTGSTVLVRQAPSVRADFEATSGGGLGSSPPVKISYSANSADYPATNVSTRKAGVIQTDVMRITWTEPPAQVKLGDTINIVFTVESGNTPTADISRDYAGFLGTLATLPPRLLADANATVKAFDYSGPEVGFISKDCKSVDTGSPGCSFCTTLCYGFVKRSLTRTIKVDANFTGVSVEVGVGKSGSQGSAVANAAHIFWEYKPQQ
jgi:parallel beta-helix repeat protein